jgi:hypothetical protein
MSSDLKITIDGIQEHKGNKTSYYMLSQLNSISEILEYKMKNGYRVYDRNNIFQKTKTYNYSHLVNQLQTTRAIEIMIVQSMMNNYKMI